MNLHRITASVASALLTIATPGAIAQTAVDTTKPAEAQPAAKIAPKPAPKAAPKPVKKVEKKDEKAVPKKVAKPAPTSAAQPIKALPGTTQTLGPGTYSTGPTTLRDKQGNVIPTSPDAYPVGPDAKKK